MAVEAAVAKATLPGFARKYSTSSAMDFAGKLGCT